jgi:hypothetical protein
MTQSPRILEALASYDFSDQDEQSIREQWIYPLLALLGYGIGTKNPVDIPFKVDLANPVRALGHRRFEVDYRPTVHGVGMWIIEAKKPDEDLFSEQHLGQAWCYATHPKVDVPFMALANGERFCLYDITEDEWDTPLLDIRQAELPSRFAELDSVLGARRVAEFVRRRQLRHLRTALLAQLDDTALDQTLRDVEVIVAEARPAVERNRQDVYLEAVRERIDEQDSTAREIGVWGMAFACMSPNSPTTGDLMTCADMIRDAPANERVGVLEKMRSVAMVGETVRMTVALRLLRLGTAVRLVDDDVCGDRARALAEEVAVEAATELADDPLGAAAHRFELVLPAFVCRAAMADVDEALTAAARLRDHTDPETWLRGDAKHGLGADATLERRIEMGFRLIWMNFAPWTVAALDRATDALRAALERTPLPRRDVRVGQVNNAFFETPLSHDPLRPGCRNVVADVADPRFVDLADAGQAARAAFAVDLIRRVFDAPARSG